MGWFSVCLLPTILSKEWSGIYANNFKVSSFSSTSAPGWPWFAGLSYPKALNTGPTLMRIIRGWLTRTDARCRSVKYVYDGAIQKLTIPRENQSFRSVIFIGDNRHRFTYPTITLQPMNTTDNYHQRCWGDGREVTDREPNLWGIPVSSWQLEEEVDPNRAWFI